MAEWHFGRTMPLLYIKPGLDVRLSIKEGQWAKVLSPFPNGKSQPQRSQGTGPGLHIHLLSKTDLDTGFLSQIPHVWLIWGSGWECGEDQIEGDSVRNSILLHSLRTRLCAATLRKDMWQVPKNRTKATQLCPQGQWCGQWNGAGRKFVKGVLSFLLPSGKWV